MVSGFTSQSAILTTTSSNLDWMRRNLAKTRRMKLQSPMVVEVAKKKKLKKIDFVVIQGKKKIGRRRKKNTEKVLSCSHKSTNRAREERRWY